ncbi:hypothetical protein M378DRAFT_182530 [Amanita muscaria Koide BX008]|uniref:Uncharacterized protein n=1 Tax=Amanita muscaria (strain Koide BX008) TaxID=946122 RepID=A0A0C2WD19_AMAMK|nr:hypothetical protein M378DRAFT_182530 [Amanita muscaria Koide BX008]
MTSMTDQTVRPKRNITLSSKLRSGDNAAEQEVASHRNTTDDANIANLTRLTTLPSDDGPTPATTTSTRSSSIDLLNAAPIYSDKDLGAASELASQRSTISIGIFYICSNFTR